MRKRIFAFAYEIDPSVTMHALVVDGRGRPSLQSNLLQAIYYVEIGEDPEVVVGVAFAVCTET
jgi:hypothetical protein